MFNLTFHKEGYENSYSGDTEECPKPRIKLIRGDTVEYIPTTTELASKPEMCIVNGDSWYYLESLGWQRGTGRWDRVAIINFLDNIPTVGDGSYTVEYIGSLTSGSNMYNQHARSDENDYIYCSPSSISVCNYVHPETQIVGTLSGFSYATDAHRFANAVKEGGVILGRQSRDAIYVKEGKIVATIPFSSYNQATTPIDLGSSLYDESSIKRRYLINFSNYSLTETTENTTRGLILKKYEIFKNENKEAYKRYFNKVERSVEFDTVPLGKYVGKNKVIQISGGYVVITDLVNFTNKNICGSLINYYSQFCMGSNGYVYILGTNGSTTYLHVVDPQAETHISTNVISGYFTSLTHGSDGNLYGFPRSGSKILKINITQKGELNHLLGSNILGW